MKCAKMLARELIAAVVFFLTFARPLVAQQEVSPDHFDSAVVQKASTPMVDNTHLKNSLHVARNGKNNSHRSRTLYAATAKLKSNRKA